MPQSALCGCFAGCPTCWCALGDLQWLVADDMAGLWLITFRPQQPQPISVSAVTSSEPLTVASCLAVIPDWHSHASCDTSAGEICLCQHDTMLTNPASEVHPSKGLDGKFAGQCRASCHALVDRASSFQSECSHNEAISNASLQTVSSLCIFALAT